jgi:hypothetical protein
MKITKFVKTKQTKIEHHQQQLIKFTSHKYDNSVSTRRFAYLIDRRRIQLQRLHGWGNLSLIEAERKTPNLVGARARVLGGLGFAKRTKVVLRPISTGQSRVELSSVAQLRLSRRNLLSVRARLRDYLADHTAQLNGVIGANTQYASCLYTGTEYAYALIKDIDYLICDKVSSSKLAALKKGAISKRIVTQSNRLFNLRKLTLKS